MDPTDPTETPIDCIDGRIPDDITTIPGAKLAG